MRKFRSFDSLALQGKVNLATDSLWLQLHTTSLAPNLDTMAHASDLTNELATGSGYTAGGAQLTGVSVAYTAANSWALAWTASAAHVVEDVIRPATGNGFLYRCSVAGTAFTTTPTWPTVLGATVTESGSSLTWQCWGNGATVLSATNETWAAPFTAGPFRYAVLVDKTPGTSSTNVLVGVSDFGAGSVSGQGGSFVETFNPEGLFLLAEV